MLIVYKNEFLLAYELIQNDSGEFLKKEIVVMAPDIISVVDEFKGQVIHSEDTCFGLKVIAFALRTDEKYKSKEALQFVGP